jgi:hypothetical protein
MQSAADRQAINHYLAKHGLGRLGDPGLLAQLGYLVDDDAEFGRLLNICEPEDRRAMYDALMPNLRFKARPLEDYLREWRETAETRQLPVMNPDGTFRPYQVPEITTEVQALVEEAVAKYHLILTCRRCTREETFGGTDKYTAVRNAREAGWVYCHGEGSVGFEICPSCD